MGFEWAGIALQALGLVVLPLIYAAIRQHSRITALETKQAETPTQREFAALDKRVGGIEKTHEVLVSSLPTQQQLADVMVGIERMTGQLGQVNQRITDNIELAAERDRGLGRSIDDVRDNVKRIDGRVGLIDEFLHNGDRE